MSYFFKIKYSCYSFLFFLLITTTICKSEEFDFNGIYIQNPWIKLTLPNQYGTSGFFKIKNKSNKDEILLYVYADFSKKSEIHLMTVKNDIMRMKKIETGIKINKGTSIIFKPGNLHLMFTGLKYQLTENSIHNITFVFKHRGFVKIPFKVKNFKKKSNKNKNHH